MRRCHPGRCSRPSHQPWTCLQSSQEWGSRRQWRRRRRCSSRTPLRLALGSRAGRQRREAWTTSAPRRQGGAAAILTACRFRSEAESARTRPLWRSTHKFFFCPAAVLPLSGRGPAAEAPGRAAQAQRPRGARQPAPQPRGGGRGRAPARPGRAAGAGGGKQGGGVGGREEGKLRRHNERARRGALRRDRTPPRCSPAALWCAGAAPPARQPQQQSCGQRAAKRGGAHG